MPCLHSREGWRFASVECESALRAGLGVAIIGAASREGAMEPRDVFVSYKVSHQRSPGVAVTEAR